MTLIRPLPLARHATAIPCARAVALGLVLVGAAQPAAAQAATAQIDAGSQAPAPSVPPRLFGDLKYRLIGPFRGGRVVAVGGVPGSGSTFYFGSVDGGVWRTTDAGVVWKPLFDAQPVASIGALAVSPADPRVLYVGTGESDIRSDLASGAGVYKSVDAGETWTHVGLGDTRQISKIVLSPSQPDVVYVGALGFAYGPNPDRGVYKSSDGGKTWRRTLYRGPQAGVADLAIAAERPNILFATLWAAHRPPWSTYAPIVGEGSGLFRSLDAGETWQACMGHGLPDGKWGRSGVAVSADGRRVYALVEAKQSGLYVSDDGGATWALVNDDARLTSRAWYFSRITVDPNDADTIYVPNIALLSSNNSGKTISVLRGAPGGDDYHELWVDPRDRNRLVLGTDQGTSISLNRGQTWSSWYNQPTAQLYHVTTDDRFPYTVYGAQQDSGGVAVASRTDHGQITPRDWFPASGSESGYLALDPADPDIVYASGTYGTVSRWDRRRSLTQDVTPWPVSVFGTDITQRKYRDPWTPPLVFSPVDKKTLYLGAQVVLKTLDGGAHWTEISPDLTGAQPSKTPRKEVSAGPGNPSAKNSIDAGPGPAPERAVGLGFGTLATVAPSYADADVLWAGSDTGVLSLTRDGGRTWSTVTPPGIRPWSKISLIEPSHFDAGVAYAAVERHRLDDRTPYVYRTRDYGKTWTAITSGLSEPNFVLAVREDPKQAGLLFAGTEFGVYVSFDDGGQWQKLQLNLPVSSVRDLAVHGDDLVVATHGRSFWILDDITPLRQGTAHAGTRSAFLYEPAVAVRIDNDAFTGTPLPPEEPTAENPPNGAPLDYYLPAAASAVEVFIYDSNHALVRHIGSEPQAEAAHAPQPDAARPDAARPDAALPIAARWFPKPQRLETGAGMHRVAWTLSWNTSDDVTEDQPDDGAGDVPRPPRVPPGQYTVELKVNGQTVSNVPLLVVKDPRSAATLEQLNDQFTTAARIFRDSLACRRALAEIAEVNGRLTKTFAAPGAWAPRVPAKPSAARAKALQSALREITEGSTGLEAANAELTSALNVVESSDRPAPAQALAVYDLARAAAQVKIAQWTKLKAGPLAGLDRQWQAEGIAPLAIREIEHEVDDLMTR